MAVCHCRVHSFIRGKSREGGRNGCFLMSSVGQRTMTEASIVCLCTGHPLEVWSCSDMEINGEVERCDDDTVEL